MNVKSLSIAAALIASLGSTAAVAADEYALNQNLPANVEASVERVARAQVAVADEYQQNLNVASNVSSKVQRAQVVAEAIEARKLGLSVGGEIGSLTATAAQAEQIRHAGLRAVSEQFAAK